MAINQISSLRMDTKFKKTPIGEIPMEWEAVHIEEVADVSGGGTPDRQNAEFWGGAIPWLTPTELTNLKSSYISDSRERITDSGLKNSAANVLPAGSILLTTRATIGSCAINLVPMTTNQGFTNFTCGERINNLFLYYTLVALKKDLEKLGAGSTFLEIPKGAIRRMYVPLPPIDEQKKITKILSSVDNAIEKADAVIAKTRDLKKALMQRILARGIGHTKFKKSSIGEIPVEWDVTALSEIAEIIMGQSPSSEDCNLDGKGWPFFQGNADFGELHPVVRAWCTSPTKKAQKGDVLISVRAPVGQINIADQECVIGRGLAALHARGVDDRFLYFGLIHATPQFGSISQGSTFEAINGKDIRQLQMAIPPIREQTKIAEILSSVDGCIEKSESERDRLEQTKKALMADLLNGRVQTL